MSNCDPFASAFWEKLLREVVVVFFFYRSDALFLKACGKEGIGTGS